MIGLQFLGFLVALVLGKRYMIPSETHLSAVRVFKCIQIIVTLVLHDL